MRFLFFALILAGSSASARVFNFNGEKFAPYLKGSYLMTSSGDAAYGTSGGTGTTFDKKNTYNSNYEFGFAYGIKGMRLRFGFEFLKPPVVSGATGSDAAGTPLYSITSDVLGLSPKIGFEINIAEWPESRLYASGDFGSVSLTVKNTYTMTAAGSSAFPGVVDFTEEVKASGQSLDGALGFETLLFDATTFAFEVGYRSLKFENLKHNLPVTSFQGAVIKGDGAKNDDGTARAMNFSNVYASVGFRFWIF